MNIAWILQLYEAGKSYDEIASLAGCTRKDVKEVLYAKMYDGNGGRDDSKSN